MGYSRLAVSQSAAPLNFKSPVGGMLCWTESHCAHALITDRIIPQVLHHIPGIEDGDQALTDIL